MRIIVVHSDLKAGGGAEQYANAVIKCAQHAGHQVSRLDRHGYVDQLGQRLRPHILKVTDLWFLRKKSLLTFALSCRALKKFATEYEAIIFTFGEGPHMNQKSLRILHAPCLFSTHPEDISLLQYGLQSWRLRQRQLYVWICRRIARPTLQMEDGVFTVANSLWTAQRTRQRTGIVPNDIVYPKVNSVQSAPVSRQAHRFVALGRIVANKRLEDAVSVLRELRSSGFPAELEIVGRADTRYAKAFVLRHAREPGLTFTLNADTKQKSRALARARFGLHCYRSEHFGIAVAEMISAGVVPLVYNDGGVRELVTTDALRFQSVDDLVKKAARLCQTSERLTDRIANRLQRSVALSCAFDFDKNISESLKRFLDQSS